MKTTTKVKELIKDEVSMGTYGLVELEVRALEQSNKDLLEALVKTQEWLKDNNLPQLVMINNAINKATL